MWKRPRKLYVCRWDVLMHTHSRLCSVSPPQRRFCRNMVGQSSVRVHPVPPELTDATAVDAGTRSPAPESDVESTHSETSSIRRRWRTMILSHIAPGGGGVLLQQPERASCQWVIDPDSLFHHAWAGCVLMVLCIL